MYKHIRSALLSIFLILAFSVFSIIFTLSFRNNPDVIGLVFLLFFIAFPLIGLIGSIIIGRIPYRLKFLYVLLVTLCAVLVNHFISGGNAFVSYPLVIQFSLIPSLIGLIVTSSIYRKRQHK